MPTIGDAIGVIADTYSNWPELLRYLSNTLNYTMDAPLTSDTINSIILYLNRTNLPSYQIQYLGSQLSSSLSGFLTTTTQTDPGNVVTVVPRVITSLAQTPTAYEVVAGKKVAGLTTKSVVLAGLIATWGVFATAAGIREHTQDFDEAIEPFTIDGEHVPVVVDDNGKAYLDERLINAFREKAVELGIFDAVTEYPEHITTGNVIYTGTTSIRACLNELISDSINSFVWTDQVTNELNTFINTWEGYPALVTVCSHDNSQGAYSDLQAILIYAYKTIDNSKLGDTYSIGSNQAVAFIRISAESRGTSQNMYITGSNTDDGIINLYIGKWGTNPIRASTFNSTESSGVEGFTPTNPTVGDLTKSIYELYPEWGNEKITLPTPDELDLMKTSDFYPVSLNQEDIDEQGVTVTGNEHDGDVGEDQQEGIIKELMRLLQDMYQSASGNPDDVVPPTVPVEDSGDTPTATPPLVSGASNGLWTIYNPTLSEVQQFGAWLWSESIIDQIKRQFANPIDGVIGFMSIYCTPITGDRKIIKAGYLNSPVSAKEVTNQYVTIDCGSLDVPEFYHTAIDYTRSKVDIYLPFIGIVPLDCSVVTGSTLQVIYRIDVLTGTCLAQIKVIKQNSDAVMYTYNGNCGVQLPLTSGTYTGLVGTIMGLGQGIISAGAGNIGGAIDGAIKVVGSMGTSVQKSGSLSSNAGALGIRIPYIIITHPTAYDAFIYNQVYGYPSNIYQRLSAMSGFVRVKKVHLDDITCTDQELEMIYSKLKEGVII